MMKSCRHVTKGLHQWFYLCCAHGHLRLCGPLSLPLERLQACQRLCIRIQGNGVLLEVSQGLLLCLQLCQDLTPARQLHPQS